MSEQHGTKCVISRILESPWKKCICAVGLVTVASIGYGARYCTKKKFMVFKSKKEKEEYYTSKNGFPLVP